MKQHTENSPSVYESMTVWTESICCSGIQRWIRPKDKVPGSGYSKMLC